jgi:hypothetical protein
VPKSAGAATRPSPLEHFASLGPALPVGAGRIILVDDVVTRGSTALGAAWRLLEAMPDVEVALFALARTVPDGAAGGFVDVVRGTIEHGGGNWLERKP